jgi:hypothetical protein
MGGAKLSEAKSEIKLSYDCDLRHPAALAATSGIIYRRGDAPLRHSLEPGIGIEPMSSNR